MLNRGSLKDAVVYLLLLVILLAVSGGVHFMYGRSSDGLFGVFGAPLNQLEAKIVVQGRIYRNLKASGRDLGPHGQDLGALTDEERRELEKARRDMFTQIINLFGQIPSRCLISLQQGTYTSVPGFFLVGFLGVFLGRYRKLFIIPLLGAVVWVSVFVAFLFLRTPSGTSVWHQFIPELTLSLGGWLMATTIALLVGCYSGRATLRALRQASSPQDVAQPIDPFLNLIAWRAVTVSMLLTSTILFAFNSSVLLSSPPSAQDMPTHMWVNQTARSPELSQDDRSNDVSLQLLEDARRTFNTYEEQTATRFKEILEALQDCRMP
jgi:hypothetical protein